MNSYKWSELYQKLLIDYNEIFSDYIVDTLSDFEKVYDADCINKAIEICRDKGFFVTYNHPT